MPSVPYTGPATLAHLLGLTSQLNCILPRCCAGFALPLHHLLCSPPSTDAPKEPPFPPSAEPRSMGAVRPLLLRPAAAAEAAGCIGLVVLERRPALRQKFSQIGARGCGCGDVGTSPFCRRPVRDLAAHPLPIHCQSNPMITECVNHAGTLTTSAIVTFSWSAPLAISLLPLLLLEPAPWLTTYISLLRLWETWIICLFSECCSCYRWRYLS